jgi:UDP-3-O-[3-hydroxymyristoyl] N-acetylglucosamine deacetylase/3-hydroxyacyl-[acyl-carrier-protein] dehydratase
VSDEIVITESRKKTETLDLTNKNQNQQTLKGSVTLHGVGLHTGKNVTMTMKPANPGFGIRFQRVDIADKPIVKADVDFVVDTSRGTTIEYNGARVSTVEHTMAALVGLGIDNVLIEMDGPEVPIMDGSAKQFMEAIDSVGIQEQEARRIVYSIDTNIHFYDPVKNVDMLAVPSTEYQISTLRSSGMK